MTEDAGVPFVPSRPAHKHCKRHHGFSIWDVHAGQVDPPILRGLLQVPQGGIKGYKLKPLLDKVPKPKHEAAFVEDMAPDFFSLLHTGQRLQLGHPRLAKRSAVPHPILNSQSSEELDLGGGRGSHPNRVLQRGKESPQELRFVSIRRRVVAIIRMLPTTSFSARSLM